MLSGDTSELIKATEIDKYVLERGNSETVFFVLHQTYALEGSQAKFLRITSESSRSRIAGGGVNNDE
jgi:hypothetical protein